MKVRVEKNCSGFDMPDGTRYRANRGVVEVDREDHLAQLPGSQVGKWGFVSVAPVTFHDPNGADCRGCGFGLFGYQTACPRCGRRRA